MPPAGTSENPRMPLRTHEERRAQGLAIADFVAGVVDSCVGLYDAWKQPDKKAEWIARKVAPKTAG